MDFNTTLSMITNVIVWSVVFVLAWRHFMKKTNTRRHRR